MTDLVPTRLHRPELLQRVERLGRRLGDLPWAARGSAWCDPPFPRELPIQPEAKED